MIERERLQELRADVERATSCPRCGAHLEQPCRGRRGPRVSQHRERIEAHTGRPLRRG